MLVHEHTVAKIREDMPLDRAALIGCGVTTGVGAAIHTARVGLAAPLRHRLWRRWVVGQRRGHCRRVTDHRHRHVAHEVGTGT